jgi:vitamin B12 transporter
MRWIFGLVMLGVMLTVRGAGAQEARKLEPVVVTATTVETPAEQLGASVTVVDGNDFQTRHYPTVDEALRKVPGLEIQRSGSFGKTTSITIRGLNANQVQVLIDGVRVKSPTLGQVDLSDVSPDLIDRIEVIRGPQSTLYGADAIGGVVNIITKKGSGPASGSVQVEGGNRDTLGSRGTVSGNYKILDYAFSASYFETNGQFQNDSSDRTSFATRLGLTLPYQSALTFVARYNHAHTGLPVKFVQPFGTPLPNDPVIDSNAAQTSETSVISLHGRTRPVPWWESEARVSRYDNRLNFVDAEDQAGCPFAPFFPCEFPAVFRVNRQEAAWLNHFHVGTWSTSTVGLEYRREHGDAQGAGVSPGFEADNHTKSVFFEQQLRFFDRLFLSAGVRVEDNSVFGTHTTERGSLAYLIKETGTKVRGGAGSGFRAPTLNDLFFPGFSNPTVKPEKSFSWDVGVDQRLWKGRVRLGLTYFHNVVDDLISTVTIPTPPFVTVGNTNTARASGVEFTSEVDLLDTLTAFVNYTYTNSDNEAAHRPLTRQPFHRWNTGLSWQPTRRLSLFTEAHVVSRQWEPTGGIGDLKLGVYNPGYARLDVGGTYRLLRRHGVLQGLDLTARIQNLLDESYAEVRGFPALGITALVGLRASF